MATSGEFELAAVRDDGLSSTGRRNAVWSVTLKVGTDDWIGLGGAAVVAEARAERVPERR